MGVRSALAHTVRNPTEAAYARSDLFERRPSRTYRSPASRSTSAGNSTCTFSSATGISAWINAMRVSGSGAAIDGTGHQADVVSFSSHLLYFARHEW